MPHIFLQTSAFFSFLIMTVIIPTAEHYCHYFNGLIYWVGVSPAATEIRSRESATKAPPTNSAEHGTDKSYFDNFTFKAGKKCNHFITFFLRSLHGFHSSSTMSNEYRPITFTNFHPFMCCFHISTSVVH